MLGPHWNYYWIYCCCPALWRSWALGLQNLYLHIVHQIIDVIDIGVGQPIHWFWAWVVAQLVSPPALPCRHHQDELSYKGQGQFLCLHSLRSGLPHLHLSGPALLCCPRSYVLQLIRDRASSPALFISGPALHLPQALMATKGWGGTDRTCLSPAHAFTWQMRNGDSVSMLTTLELTCHYLPSSMELDLLCCPTEVQCLLDQLS